MYVFLQVNAICKFSKEYFDSVIKVIARYLMLSKRDLCGFSFSLLIWTRSLGKQSTVFQVVSVVGLMLEGLANFFGGSVFCLSSSIFSLLEPFWPC